MYLDFVGDLDELYAACRIGYDVNAPHGMALIAEIQRQDSLIGALQADNMRLRGLIAEAVEDMGRGGMCIHAGLKGRMVQAMTPNATSHRSAACGASGGLTCYAWRRRNGKANRVFHDGDAPGQRLDSCRQCVPIAQGRRRLAADRSLSVARPAGEGVAMHGAT